MRPSTERVKIFRLSVILKAMVSNLFCLFIYMFIYPSIHPFIHVSVYLSAEPRVSQCVCPTFQLTPSRQVAGGRGQTDSQVDSPTLPRPKLMEKK